MRHLSFLCVVLAALLCAGTVLAQSGDDNNGNVLYVQTDNYVVHTYGEYTNPVIEYWTRDQPNDKYKVWVDSIYEVAPQQSTPAPGKEDPVVVGFASLSTLSSSSWFSSMWLQ
jgi:hypothetical protein